MITKFKDRILAVDPTLDNVPNGYKRLGDYIILRSFVELSPDLGTAVLMAYNWCTGVYQHLTTEGESRNPKLKYLAGNKNTELIHVENSVKYVLDIDRVMFSGGNLELRRQLVDLVDENENLLDMFAAVGNLSLQILVHKRVNAILVERNPITFEYLKKSVIENNLEGVDCRNIDCRDLELDEWADRIFMGYHNIEVSHLTTAISAAKMKCVIHLHPIAKRHKYEEITDRYTHLLEELGVKIVDMNVQKIKDYSPNLHHIQVIYSIEK